MGNPLFAQYADNLLKLNAAFKSGSLYKKELVDGKLENKSGSGFLWSILTHVYYVMTSQTDKIKAIEEQKFKTIFEKNIDFIQNRQHQPDPKYATWSITNLTRKEM